MIGEDVVKVPIRLNHPFVIPSAKSQSGAVFMLGPEDLAGEILSGRRVDYYVYLAKYFREKQMLTFVECYHLSFTDLD